MKVVFITKYFSPHIGGVEKHVYEISKNLQRKGHKISIITENYSGNLKENETVDGIKVNRLSYPKIKFLGLLIIWLKLLRYLKLLAASDTIHIHDVAIWYLPLRFILFWKPIFLTIHGWEGQYPIPKKNIFQKKLAVAISRKTILVGSYIEKYYGVQGSKIIYGATNAPKTKHKKDPKLIVFVGRLSPDTGLKVFLKAAQKLGKYKIIFCGDGELANKCRKYGEVTGFVNPQKYLARASICFASGYLTILEALANRCRVITNYNNPLRYDMLHDSPFSDFIALTSTSNEIHKAANSQDAAHGGHNFAKRQTWAKLANIYSKLWL